jgi:hypothetical protein
MWRRHANEAGWWRGLSHLFVEIPRPIRHALRHVKDLHILPTLPIASELPQPVLDSIAEPAMHKRQNSKSIQEVYWLSIIEKHHVSVIRYQKKNHHHLCDPKMIDNH